MILRSRYRERSNWSVLAFGRPPTSRYTLANAFLDTSVKKKSDEGYRHGLLLEEINVNGGHEKGQVGYIVDGRLHRVPSLKRETFVAGTIGRKRLRVIFIDIRSSSIPSSVLFTLQGPLQTLDLEFGRCRCPLPVSRTRSRGAFCVTRASIDGSLSGECSLFRGCPRSWPIVPLP